MLILSVRCHRPRTQRLGMNSMPRELYIFTGEEQQARMVIQNMRKSHAEMVKAGYPWPGGDIVLPDGAVFQSGPNDNFYLVVEEEKELS